MRLSPLAVKVNDTTSESPLGADVGSAVGSGADVTAGVAVADPETAGDTVADGSVTGAVVTAAGVADDEAAMTCEVPSAPVLNSVKPNRQTAARQSEAAIIRIFWFLFFVFMIPHIPEHRRCADIFPVTPCSLYIIQGNAGKSVSRSGLQTSNAHYRTFELIRQ